VDFFAFEARRGQQVIIDVDARSLTPPSPLDSVVTLFDSRGQQLAENDDADGSTDSRLQFAIPADGRYFFRVRSFDGKGGPSYVYRVTVTLTGATRPQEREPNDQFAQANQLVPDTPIAGTIAPAGDTECLLLRQRARTHGDHQRESEEAYPPFPGTAQDRTLLRNCEARGEHGFGDAGSLAHLHHAALLRPLLCAPH
jgi:hypothetical protein